MKENNLSKSLEELEYVFESGKANFFGYRLVNNKRFKEALGELETSLIEEVKEAKEIMQEKEYIIESSKEEARRLIEDTKEYIKNLDVISEARRLAQEIIDEAQEQAQIERENSRVMSENAIQYGEATKNKLILQGQQFVREQIRKSLEGFEKSGNELAKSYEEITSMIESIEEQEEKRDVS